MQTLQRDLLLLAIVGMALYYFLGKVKDRVGDMTAPISQAIANAWLAITLPSPMNVLGGIAFGDGTVIDINDVQLRANQQTGAVQFLFGGHIYNLSASDANGNWPATLVQ